ncbi:hypothetical protein SZN_23896 [Streptomyces zinciresistens K42]|uniref:Uncharacterized protein n=1 Tax=Streptomyces zinciresistens K42 TaxID=700597 RepID=G2GGZ5_9ACTN|nr:hypothetical protein [Streptomyces zinciresistens]EGX57243.1 hypothetical protein SZN_23896 [Streptomyces zinciresistens K42]
MSATAHAPRATGPARPPGQRLLGGVPQGFAVSVGAFGLLCALRALIPPLRVAPRPVVAHARPDAPGGCFRAPVAVPHWCAGPRPGD